MELSFLSLFLIFLPSLEAPKNLFLVAFIFTSLLRKNISSLIFHKWNYWDLTFAVLILSALLSAVFPGILNGNVWKGFRGIALWISFGWLMSYVTYKTQEKFYLFCLALLASIPPLLFGLLEYFSGTKAYLELHSVGHVNHSAIYLCMIFGAVYGLNVYIANKTRKINFFLMFLALFFFVAIVIGQSRGAFVAALLIHIILTLFFDKLKIRLSLFLALILLIASTVLLNTEISKKQIANQEQGIVMSNRDKVWNTAIEISRIYPIFGIGNGNWTLIKIDQIKSSVESRGVLFLEDRYANFSHPHNIYFASLADRGFIGLFVFLNFMILWLLTIKNSYKKYSANLLFVYASFSSWLSIFVIGLVNTTFHHENALLALFFLGLHLSFIRKHKHQT